jgi:hypothetical protein
VQVADEVNQIPQRVGFPLRGRLRIAKHGELGIDGARDTAGRGKPRDGPDCGNVQVGHRKREFAQSDKRVRKRKSRQHQQSGFLIRCLKGSDGLCVDVSIADCGNNNIKSGTVDKIARRHCHGLRVLKREGQRIALQFWDFTHPELSAPHDYDD